MRTSSLGPAPRATTRATHKVMVSNRGRDTKPELDLRSALWSAGVRGFRINYRVGKTRVDISLPSKKVAILVNGCFWHRCRVCRLPMPKSHADFWARKFRLTRIRDARARRSIRGSGWRLVELWEHQVRDELDFCVDAVKAARKSNPTSG